MILLTPLYAALADSDTLRADARTGALDNLISAIRALKLEGDKSIADVLGAVKGVLPAQTLIEGAEEQALPRYYSTGECGVKVRIPAQRLRENVAKMIKEHAPDFGVAPESLRTAGEYVIVEGRAREGASSQERRPQSGPPNDLAGWERVDALDRAPVEKSALETARQRALASITGLLKGSKSAEALGPRIAQAIAAIPPESKAYVAGGIVEVNVRISSKDFLAALRATGEADKKSLEPEAADEISKRFGENAVAASAYASVSGKPPDEKELDRFVTLKPELFPHLLAKPKPEGEEKK
jgi:hypothetical protein